MGYIEGERLVDFEIEGEAASKSNSRRAFQAGAGGRRFFAKSEKAESYSDTFKRLCPKFFPTLKGPLFAMMHIHYASRRPDLDETLILDLMQTFIYDNDRQVKGRLTLWGLDPERPRCRIALWHMVQTEPEGGRRAPGGKRRPLNPASLAIQGEGELSRSQPGRGASQREGGSHDVDPWD